MVSFADMPTITEDMFALLKHSWVWDFFFASDDKELDMLHYAFAKETLVSMVHEMSTEHMESSTHIFNLSQKQNFLFLPSFTMGTISVGFGINHVVHTNQTVVSADTYLCRVARDDETGSSVLISEQFNENVTSVSFYSLIDTLYRENRYCLFKKKPFRQAIERLNTDGFDLHAFKNAVILSFHSFDARPCLKCGQPRFANCNCALQLQRKRRPFDDEREVRSDVSFAGTYRGLASLQVFDNGTQLFQGDFMSTLAQEPIFDGAFQRKLGVWALRKAANNQRVNPLALLIDGFATQTSSDSDTPLPALLTDSTNDSTTQFDLQSIPVVDDALEGKAGVILAEALWGKDLNVVSSSNAQREPTEGSIVSSEAALGLDAVDEVMLAQSGPIIAEMEEGEEEVDGIQANSASSTSSAQSAAKTKEVEMMREQFAKIVTAAETQVGTSSEKRVESRVEKRLRHPFVLAPAIAKPPHGPVTANIEAAAAVAEGTAGDDEAVRNRKAELRKERNRESAQRSNLKRKLRMQKLKYEMAELSNREIYLRAREKILLEENVSLKATLSK